MTTPDTVFDFNDGNGEVPAIQWANGGGWVACSAHVNESVYVSGNAQVSGDARVSKTPIFMGIILADNHN